MREKEKEKNNTQRREVYGRKRGRGRREKVEERQLLEGVKHRKNENRNKAEEKGKKGRRGVKKERRKV